MNIIFRKSYIVKYTSSSSKTWLTLGRDNSQVWLEVQNKWMLVWRAAIVEDISEGYVDRSKSEEQCYFTKQKVCALLLESLSSLSLILSLQGWRKMAHQHWKSSLSVALPPYAWPHTPLPQLPVKTDYHSTCHAIVKLAVSPGNTLVHSGMGPTYSSLYFRAQPLVCLRNIVWKELNNFLWWNIVKQIILLFAQWIKTPYIRGHV